MFRGYVQTSSGVCQSLLKNHCGNITCSKFMRGLLLVPVNENYSLKTSVGACRQYSNRRRYSTAKRFLGHISYHLSQGKCLSGSSLSASNLLPSFFSVNEQLQTLLRNPAFQHLHIKLDELNYDECFSTQNTAPKKKVSFTPSTVNFASLDPLLSDSPTTPHPPSFVQPHPPFHVFAAPILNVRTLTNPGAIKRTYNVTLDISKYPLKEGSDWKIGGSFGVMPPNPDNEIFRLAHLLNVPLNELYDPKTLHTSGGRWPTIWGEEKPRSLEISIYHVLKWCSDFLSRPPSKDFYRLLAKHSKNPIEHHILLGLSNCSQNICSENVSISDVLEAFPNSRPSIDEVISLLPQLMPRWYSISNDPDLGKGVLEMAFTVQEFAGPDGQMRTGVCSGFLENMALEFIKSEQNGTLNTKKFTLPMFRGVQQNPFAKEFHNDGPMCLIGAGVGIAPFRGFVQRRLANAACTGKVWIIQGCRDQTLDELYHGEWNTIPGHHTNPKCRAKKLVVESRNGRREYVQDAVRRHGKVIWDVINHKNGRIYLCGSGKAFAVEIEKAIIDVTMKYSGCTKEEAVRQLKYWQSPINYKFVKEVW
ncbi:FAD binding protein [Schizosaccharomyces octosporus yFS286]|uniref:FAD binding protein n=1 Tax=Schizosaccharomyces octosporus (strain yFS286) TaxID=483514 RepID=S9PN09_SCHOY|nr:FAD binding protein [Schizosaccharomyces octosporus yFS286]EPX70611.1 FAD binding protein [Schizosaccharomyces octosporus yFS286]